MTDISNARILILATNGFEQSELEVPRDRLREAGAEVHVVSPDGEPITGWEETNWGQEVAVDRALAGISAEDYDAIVLPGGQINPDILRTVPEAVALVRAFHDKGRVVAAICHGPWMLVEAGVVSGRKVTSYKSIRRDVENAGGLWEDSEVACDRGIVTSRNPGDLPAFCAKIIEEIAEGRHERHAA